MKIKIKKIQEKRNVQALKESIQKYPYKPYARMKLYQDSGRLDQYYYELFFGEKNTVIFSAEINGKSKGILVYNISGWDSCIFGMKMARLGYFSAEEEYARAVIIKEKLLREACRYSKAHGVKFLSIRVESDDHASIHALENNRFRIMDNLVTYIYRDRLMDQEKILFAQARRWFNVVPMKKQDLAVAGDLLVERFKMGHYLADPAISSEKSKAMYRRWLEGKFKKAADNDLFVAKRQNKVVGFSLLSLNTLLEQYTGLKSLHKGLVAVEASSSGCIIALMNAELKKRQDLDFAEFETQTHNYAMLRVMQKLDMQPIRSRYTFHCAL